MVEGNRFRHFDTHGEKKGAEGDGSFDCMVGGSEFCVGGMRRDIGCFLGLRGNGDAKKGEDGAHGGSVIAEVMGHSRVCMGDKMVGVGVGLFLVR